MERNAMEALIARMPDGDLEALESLYRDFHHAVFSYARLLLQDREQAEDTAQDVFLKVWDKASTYRPGGSPKAWILAIARNAAFDRMRAAGRETGIDDMPEDVFSAEDARVEGTAINTDLRRALATLEPQDRRIVVLKAVAGLPAREVARLTGLPPSTVAWRYRRALAKLGALLEEGETR